MIFLAFPVSCVDSRTDAFSHGFPNIRKLQLHYIRSGGVEFARALVAYAARPALRLGVSLSAVKDSDRDVWHLFDTILFALRICHKSQVDLKIEDYEKHIFPLMSLFG